jgi:hypothetical protein
VDQWTSHLRQGCLLAALRRRGRGPHAPLRADEALPRCDCAEGCAACPATERRTVAQLLAACDGLVEAKKQNAAERSATELAHGEREQTESRAKYLDDLGRREAEALITTKRPKDCDRAVTLLMDLRDLAGRSGRTVEAEARIQGLRQRHSNKPSLLKRFDNKRLGR